MTRQEFLMVLSDTKYIDRTALATHDAEQRQRIEELERELSERTNLEGSAPCWNSAHMQQITKLWEALTNLYALVEGECPSLLNEDSGGDAQLAMQIEQALKERP